jgi:hypothetical protein
MCQALVAAAFVGCMGVAGPDSRLRDARDTGTAGRTKAQPGTTTVSRTADTVITIRRRFDAPAGSVFAALTTPDLLRRWMSAGGRELVECQVDLRKGGSYRYAVRYPSKEICDTDFPNVESAAADGFVRLDRLLADLPR